MRNEEYIVLGLAGLALWFIIKGRAANGTPATIATDFARKAAPDYQGWQYFTDGTSISPKGEYYHNGQLVWTP